MHDYVTLSALKKSSSLSATSYADDDINSAISSASRAIENMCERRFWLDDDETSVRYYTADDRGSVEINDLADLTELATDTGADGTFSSVWTLGTDFFLTPLNAAADGWPWTRLEARTGGSFLFPTFMRGVRVTGQFGWPAVPQPIVDATALLATQLVKRKREATFGAYAMGQDGYAIRIGRSDAHICALIDPYRRHRVAVA